MKTPSKNAESFPPSVVRKIAAIPSSAPLKVLTFSFRILHLVAVWFLFLLGGEEDERDGAAVLPLLHWLRGGQPSHAPPSRLHIHLQVARHPDLGTCQRVNFSTFLS